MDRPTMNTQLREMRLLVLNTMGLLDQLGSYHGEHGRRLLEEHMCTLRTINTTVLAQVHAMNNVPTINQVKAAMAAAPEPATM